MSAVRRFAGRPNVPILLLSLFLAFVCWAVVTTQETATQRDISVSLRYGALNPHLALDRPPPQDWMIKIAGPADFLKGIADKPHSAYVDLSQVHQPGTHLFTIGLPPDLRDIAVPTGFPRMTLTVDEVKSMPYTVQTGTSGRLNDPSVILTARDVAPHMVQVTGPRAAVKKVAQARVTIDLNKVHIDNPVYDGYVRLYDASGNQIDEANNGITIEPPNVQVHLGFSAAPVEKTVFVLVMWKGHPDNGFRVTTYDAAPTNVKISGSSLALASTRQVETEPVDLTGLTSSREFKAKVMLPPGVTASDPRTVRVRVTVHPLPNAPHA